MLTLIISDQLFYHRTLVILSLTIFISKADSSGETVCNIPVSGTLLAGDAAAPYS